MTQIASFEAFMSLAVSVDMVSDFPSAEVCLSSTYLVIDGFSKHHKASQTKSAFCLGMCAGQHCRQSKVMGIGKHDDEKSHHQSCRCHQLADLYKECI